VLQGLTEFLPVSSSAHLALAPLLFGWRDPGLAFDVALHLGTLVALLWYFRADWAALVKGALTIVRTRRVSNPDERRVVLLIIATIPAAVGGLLLEEYAETVFRAPHVTAVMLIVMGILLWAADRFFPRERQLDSLRTRDAVLIGLAQVAALVPGVSRSGSTMTAGRALGRSMPSAARFSFLMSMPITAAAVILKTPEVIREQGVSTALVVGVLAAALSSWLAIAVLLRYLARHSFGVFAVYRVLLGVFTLYVLSSRG
jgi:undecaprenyl-diphosphatase